MDEKKLETIAVTGRRIKASILPIALCICSLLLYLVPYVISLSLGHTHFEDTYAQPSIKASPERILYQIFASPTICFILLTGFARFLFAKTVCQLRNLRRWVQILNVLATFVLVLSTFGFFINVNLTNRRFEDVNYFLSYMITSGFLLHFAIQIPISFKMIEVKGNENVICFRILIIFLQIVIWLIQSLGKHFCREELHGMFHCEEHMSKGSAVMMSWILPITILLQFMLYYWDFKTIWIDTHIYIKDEDKQCEEDQSKQIVIYNTPNYLPMRWIPSSLVVVLICSVMVPMIMVVVNETGEFKQFPSISPGGPDTPQADLYTCMTAIASYLGFAFVMTHYNVLKNILVKYHNQHSSIRTMNTISAFTGIMMFIGLNVAGIVLLDETMHTVSSGFFFLNGLFYMSMVAGISHVIGKETIGIIKTIRIILVCLGWLSVAGIIVLLILKTKDSLNVIHLGELTNKEMQITFVLNVFEWMMMLCIIPFICTFAVDFKSVFINLTPSINNTILDDRCMYKLRKLDVDDEAEVTAV